MVADAGACVLVIGSVNTDLVCRVAALPRAGETLRGLDFATYPGGKGANQAVAAARAGALVTLVGAVGDDAFGAARRAELAADHIDISRLRGVAGVPTGTALIVVDAAGENQIVIVPGANAAVTVADALDALANVPHVVLSLTLETPFETVAAVLTHARAGVRVVLNAAPFDARLHDVLPLSDVLICNQPEAAALLGHSIGSDSVPAAAELLALGPHAVIVTLGAAGATFASADGAGWIQAPRVRAVDATGAGDAFCGAFTAWLAADWPFEQAVRAGVAAGALAVKRHGAQPSLPRRAEILDMLSALETA